MRTIANNASAICRLKSGVVTTAIQNNWAFASMLSGISDTGLLYGTEEGEVYYYNRSTGRKHLLFSEPSHSRILQISSQGNIVGILTECDDDEEYSLVYHVDLKTLGRPQKVGANGDYLFTPFSMLMYNNSFYGVFFAEEKSLLPIRNIEFFESNNNIYDSVGFYFAINKFMSTATVYTLNIFDQTNWQEDTFSFEGKLLTKLREELGKNQQSEYPTIEFCDFDDLEKETVDQENIFNKMLHPSMVRVGHNPYTYLDFVKMTPSDNPKNPYVISGGRDGKILITNFIEHKVFFDKTFENIPRCCSVTKDRIYVGCDDGVIVIIDIRTFKYKILSGIGEQRITTISADDKYIIAANVDDVAFCLNAQTCEICGCEMFDDDIVEVTVCDGVPYVLNEEGRVSELR